MNIGLLTFYYPPEMGAAPNRLLEMVRGLEKLGNKVSIVAAMPNYPTGKIFPEYKGKFSSKEFLEGREIKRLWLYTSNSKKSIPRILSMVSFAFTSIFSLGFLKKKNLDYLIVESPPLPLAWTGRWLAKFSGAKFVLNISDLWPLSAKELGAISDGKLYHLIEKLESYVYRKSFIATGQSQEITDYIGSHGAKKPLLFRNGVDCTRFEGLNKQKGSEDKPLQIIYAGLLGYAQGIADICKNINFKALGAEFHIYGTGGEREVIESFIKKHPENGIVYHGVVSRDELPSVLVNADVTIIPLVTHIFGAVPSKIYEAMAAGLPIIFMGKGEGASIIKENKLGFVVDPKDYDSLKNVIVNLPSKPEDLKFISNNCKQAAELKFSRPQQIKILNDFLLSNMQN